MPGTVDFEIVHKNQTEPITFYVRSTLSEDLTDVAGTSTFRLIKISDDSVEDSGSFGPSGSAKITRVAEGIYQYNFNAGTYSDEYILALRLVLDNETVSQDVFIRSVAAKYFAYAAQLSIQVDKARKSVSDQIINMDADDNQPSLSFFYGYDSKHYIFYLDRGMQYLNAIPPYTGMSVESFPFDQYGTILIDAATIAALESQGIFAIDTDFNYVLGGNSLVIDHFTKLSAAVSSILNRFSKTAISWKQGYRSKGLVMFQFMPGGVRSARMLNSLPESFWSRLLSQVFV